MMYRLHVKMKNGNCPWFDFFTMADAVEYRDARRMATNSAIARTWVESITFSQWKADNV
jgi:hypothetical protein